MLQRQPTAAELLPLQAQWKADAEATNKAARISEISRESDPQKQRIMRLEDERDELEKEASDTLAEMNRVRQDLETKGWSPSGQKLPCHAELREAYAVVRAQRDIATEELRRVTTSLQRELEAKAAKEAAAQRAPVIAQLGGLARDVEKQRQAFFERWIKALYIIHPEFIELNVAFIDYLKSQAAFETAALSQIKATEPEARKAEAAKLVAEVALTTGVAMEAVTKSWPNKWETPFVDGKSEEMESEFLKKSSSITNVTRETLVYNFNRRRQIEQQLASQNQPIEGTPGSTLRPAKFPSLPDHLK